ncbi:translation elongation factor 2 (EF-2/EF-G) [Desulfobotulus alkaliphilus]|uniref:Elongation factor G n=1 Tax=Desulfobotulus alkaliphilus TaxID=622671 RepID=A0A562RYW5_9BACT|nr:elongation factor G [Desulfobotulus alkaliphilus]TWI74321.1 translation elongation factor 2 (EF-2/EF-G) [Desulfobotulus alkaliphilus]
MSEKAKFKRNIALVGHSGSGKTILAERLLFDNGLLSRMGRVEDGNTVMDFEAEEIARGGSVSTGLHAFTWKKHEIMLLDTPGNANFFSDTLLCMQAAETVFLVVDAVDGIRVKTEEAMESAAEQQKPTVLFINKMDKERTVFNDIIIVAESLLNIRPVKVQLPLMEGEVCTGFVDLMTLQAYAFGEDGKSVKTDIPADLQDEVEMERMALVEAIAEADDSLLERYLEGDELSGEELAAGLKKAVTDRVFVPVLMGSALTGAAMDYLMDFIVQSTPCPLDNPPRTAMKGDGEVPVSYDESAPFSGFVFKTVVDPFAGLLNICKVVSGTLGKDGAFLNVSKDEKERYSQLYQMAGKQQKPITEAQPGDIVAFAKLKSTGTFDSLCDESLPLVFPQVSPLAPCMGFAAYAAKKGDEDKVFASLARLAEEDKAIRLERNATTSEILVYGVGQVHIETIVEKLRRKFKVEVDLKTPKIPYKETITRKVRVQGRHKKQTGGHGQFGDCWVRFEPLPRGEGFQFGDEIVGGSIPKQYIPAVEKGLVEASAKGVLAGFPCVDFKAIADDGSFHAVDSSEMAFKIAASLAYKKGMEEAKPVLLEPIYNVFVKAPSDYMGDIMGDLNSRRGRVMGMDTEGKTGTINAQVPLAEIQKYAPDLTSMTGGRGTFTSEFSHYEEVPGEIAQKIIDAARQEAAA